MIDQDHLNKAAMAHAEHPIKNKCTIVSDTVEMHEYYLTKAFIAGAAWMQDQNQWIPVSQGLPEPHKRVEIWVSNQFTTCHLAVGFVNRGKQWHALYNNPQESGCYPMEYVTHYREIVGPKPPKP